MELNSLDKKKVFVWLGLILILALAIPITTYLYKNQLKSLINKTPSKTYVSSVNFDSQKINKIPQKAVILGRGIPQSSVELSITPNIVSTKLKTDDEGNWIYSLSANSSPGNYRLTSFIEDRLQNLISITSYKIAIDQNKPQSFNLNKLISDVRAQTPEEIDMNAFSEWSAIMRGLGIWPQLEDGEIILYSPEEYNTRFCQPHSCLLRATPPDIIIQQTNINDIIIALRDKLIENGYHPDVLLEYFETLPSNYKPLHPLNPTETYQTTIDEATLARLIQKVYTDRSLLPSQVVESLGPIVGLPYWQKVFAGKERLTTAEEQVEALLALTILAGPAKLAGHAGFEGLKLTAKTTLNVAKMLGETRTILQSIKNTKSGISYSAVRQRAQTWVTVLTLPGRYTNKLLPKSYPAESELWWRKIVELSLENETHVMSMDPSLTRPVLEKVADGIENLIKSGVIKNLTPLPKEQLLQIADNRWVLAVFNPYMSRFATNAGAVSEARTILITFSDANNPYVLAHEGIHSYYYLLNNTNKVIGKYFVFGGESKYDRLMSMIFEYATDDLAVFISKASSRYAEAWPQIHQQMDKLVSYLIKYSNSRFSYADLKRFSLTADDGVLLEKIFGNKDVARNKALFENFMQDILEPAQIERIYRRSQPFLSRQSNQVSLSAAGLTGLGFAAAISTVAATNSDIPPQTSPPSYGEDVSFLKPDFENQLDFNGTVTITKVNGENTPGGTVEISTIVTESGFTTDFEQYDFTYSLSKSSSAGSQNRFLSPVFAQEENLPESTDEVTPLPGGEDCQQTCQVTLPEDLQPGTYNLVVYLTKEGSDEILDSNSYPLIVQAPQATPSPELSPSATPSIDEPFASPFEPPISTDEESCRDDREFTEFAGCREDQCGREYYRCPTNGDVKEFDSPEGGDCACKGEDETFTPPVLEEEVAQEIVKEKILVKKITAQYLDQTEIIFDLDQGIDNTQDFSPNLSWEEGESKTIYVRFIIEYSGKDTDYLAYNLSYNPPRQDQESQPEQEEEQQQPVCDPENYNDYTNFVRCEGCGQEIWSCKYDPSKTFNYGDAEGRCKGPQSCEEEQQEEQQLSECGQNGGDGYCNLESRGGDPDNPDKYGCDYNSPSQYGDGCYDR